MPSGDDPRVSIDGTMVVVEFGGGGHATALSTTVACGLTVGVDPDDLRTVVRCSVRTDVVEAVNVALVLGVTLDELARPSGHRSLRPPDPKIAQLAARAALLEAFEHPRYRCGTPRGLWFSERLAVLHSLGEHGIAQGSWLEPLARAAISPLLRWVPRADNRRGLANDLVAAALAYLAPSTIGHAEAASLLADVADPESLVLWMDFEASASASTPPWRGGLLVFRGDVASPSTGSQRTVALWPNSLAVDFRSLPAEVLIATHDWAIDVLVELGPRSAVSQPMCARVVRADGTVAGVGSLLRSDRGLEATVYVERFGAADRVEVVDTPSAPVYRAQDYEFMVARQTALTRHRARSLLARSTRKSIEASIASDDEVLRPFFADEFPNGERHQPSSE